MPFSSKAQERFLYAKHPDIAKRWQSEAPVDIKALPDKVKKPSAAAKRLLSGK